MSAAVKLKKFAEFLALSLLAGLAVFAVMGVLTLMTQAEGAPRGLASAGEIRCEGATAPWQCVPGVRR